MESLNFTFHKSCNVMHVMILYHGETVLHPAFFGLNPNCCSGNNMFSLLLACCYNLALKAKRTIQTYWYPPVVRSVENTSNVLTHNIGLNTMVAERLAL